MKLVTAPGATFVPIPHERETLILKAVMPSQPGDRIRVVYDDLMWSVTRTLPPWHAKMGNKSLFYAQKGLIAYIFPEGQKISPGAAKRCAS